MISLGRITLLGYLRDVKSEFRADVRLRIVFVGHAFAVSSLELWIIDSDGPVYVRMPLGVRGVVRKGSQRKRVFIRVLRILEQVDNEVSAADVMHEIAKMPIPERVITNVLNH